MTVLARADKLAVVAQRAGWRVLVREYGPAGEHQGRVLLTALRGDQAVAVQWRMLPKSTRSIDGLVPKVDADGQRVHDWSEDWCYLWRREHSTTVAGYRQEQIWRRGRYAGQHVLEAKMVRDPSEDEVVAWRSEKPTPDKVTITELKAALVADQTVLIES